MLTLNDGRTELWQWDTGRNLTVDADCSQVHFSNKVFGRSIDVDVVDGVATIPDILLQTDKELTAWAFFGTPENGYTKISKVFKVNKRPKPADYVFTPPEQTTLAEIMERLDDLKAIQDPDAIKNAVDDYLANNPVIVEEADPTVPDWAKQPDPPDVKIPDKLPNPNSITFTGAVNASYDGSNPVEIKIPDSGGNFDYAAYGLPIVYLTGDVSAMSKDNKVTLDYVYGEHSGTAKVKWQGNSSIAYPKKNYSIEFDTAFETKTGWGEQKKYCLKANYIDHSHARNVVSAKLWGEIVKSRNVSLGFAYEDGKITTNDAAYEFEDGILTSNFNVFEDGTKFLTDVALPTGGYDITCEAYLPEGSTDLDVAAYYLRADTNATNYPKATLTRAGVWETITIQTVWAEGSVTYLALCGLWTRGAKFRNIRINGLLGADSFCYAPIKQIQDLPNGGAVDGFPCIIMLNNEFHGLYTFNIPKDRWMFGMNDSTVPQAILCADTQNDACGFKALATLTDDFDLEYVSDENNSEWVLTSLNKLISAVMNSDGTDLDTNVARYLDWQSAIDYLIFSVLLRGHDMCRKNYLLVTYNGVKWFFSAYDMDSTYSLYWDGKSFDSAKGYPLLNHYDHRVMELIYTYKKDELLARYEEIRNTVMSEDNVYLKFTNFAAAIPSPLLVEDVKRWPTIPSSSASNTTQILNWYRMRVAVIDKEVEAL